MARGKKKEKELTPEEKLQQALVSVEEQPYKVPDNWCWSKLALVYEVNPKNNAEDDLEAAFVPMEKITAGMKGEFQFEIQPWGKARKGHTQFADGDVAFAKISPCFENGKSMIVNGLPNGIGGGTTELIVLRQSCMNQHYTYWLISTDQFIRGGCQTYSGTVGQQRISMDYVKNYPIPIPPIPEQQRIVDRIESLFAKLDEAKEKAQAVVDGFEDRKAAILHKAFTGELTAEWRKKRGISSAEWKAKTVGEISYVKGGKRVPKGMSLTDVDTGHPYLKAGNLKQGTVIDKDMSFVPGDVLPLIKNYTVKAGDVYITNVGACIGDCGVIPTRFDGANLTENAVKLTNLQCISEYLALYLSSNSVQSFIKTLIASATLGKLSIANIKTIPILLPSEEEQNQVIELIEKLLGKELGVRKIAEQVIDQIDVMKKSILARAFRGELGTNDPTDESAEELLKKIL